MTDGEVVLAALTTLLALGAGKTTLAAGYGRDGATVSGLVELDPGDSLIGTIRRIGQQSRSWSPGGAGYAPEVVVRAGDVGGGDVPAADLGGGKIPAFAGTSHGAGTTSGAGTTDEAETTGTPLAVTWACGGDGLVLVFEFPPESLHTEAWARVVQRRVGRLCELLETAPTTALQDLDFVHPDEWAVIARSNDTDHPYPEVTIPAQLHATATRLPDHTALVDGEKTVTFAQLDRLADAFATQLARHDLAPGDVVGLMPRRGWEQIAGLLGVLRAGLVYAPLSPLYPPERVADILQDCQAKALLVGDPAWAAFAGDRLPVIDLTAADNWHDQPPFPDRGDPHGRCAVLYTSGTTGRPKGVLVRHDTVVSYGCFNWQTWPITEADKITQFAPFTFTTYPLEVTAALFSGAELHLVTNEQIQDPRLFATYLATHQVTITLLPPEYANYLPPTPGLRIVETGASECRPDVSAKFVGAGVAHVNAYGLTEAAVPLVWHGSDGPRPARIPIGRPPWNAQVQVLDERGRPCGLYQPGELTVTGLTVSDGYLNRPAEQAAKFAPNPAGPGLMARSGDLVRWNADGDIEYLGRADDQVKVRGQRVELGEIEVALAAVEKVTATAAVAVTTPSGDTQIVGVAVADEPLDLTAVHGHLAKVLVPYMVPARLVQVDALPLTVNGKVDKQKLKAQVAPGPDTAATASPAPASPTQALLVGLFAQTLERGDVTPESDFFVLGGHSLSAARLVALAEAILNRPVGLGDLFRHPTPAALAAALDQAPATPPAPAAPAVTSAGGPGRYPASAAQAALYTLTQLDPTGTLYNVPTVLAIEGPVDPARVQAALDGLVDRHEVLRTSFEEADGRLWQRVHAPGPRVTLEQTAIADTSEATRDRLVRAFVRPFDFARPPLFRLLLATAPGDRHLLLADIHHTLADGTSLNLLFADFAALYAGEALPPVTLHYKDHAAWLEHQDFSAQLDWWKQQFPTPPEPLELPTDRPRPAHRAYQAGLVRRDLPRQFREAVERTANHLGATEQQVTLAAFAAFLGLAGRTDDLVVGIPSANRQRPHTQKLVGLLVNSLAIPARPQPGLAFADLVAQVKAACLDAYAHQDVPFDQVALAVTGPRDPSRQPLCDVYFAFQNITDETVRVPGVRLTGTQAAYATAKFDLGLALTPQPDEGYALVLEYDAELFDQATAEWFARHYTTLLAGACADPAQALADLPTDVTGVPGVTEDANHPFDRPARSGADPSPDPADPAGSTGSADPSAGADPESTLVALFDAAVARYGDAPAISATDATLSFAELERRSRRLAWRLRQLGLGRGDRVGLLGQGGATLVAAAWGILRSGATAVGLDAAYPADRLAFLLADSGAQALVTDGAAPPDWGGAADSAGPAPGVTVINAADPAFATGPEAPPLDDPPRPGDIAYLAYTSGTTGRPKGALIPHGSIARAVRLDWPWGLFDGTVTLAPFSTAFDPFWLTPVGLPLRGACAVVPTAAEMESPTAFAALARRSGATSIIVVPSRLAFLVGDPAAPDWLDQLQVAALGGEVAPAALWERLRDHRVGRVLNIYGPAETTVCVAADEVRDGGDVTLGRPLAAVGMEVTGPAGAGGHGRPLGVGLPGELVVVGPLVGLGYHDRPELTAARFWTGPDGRRRYATGDLARWRADGRLAFLGRVDDQVKLNGVRIEPGEVQAALEALPGVGQAAVLAVPGPAGEPILAAFYAPATAAPPAEVRRALARTLPRPYLPSRLLRLDGLPADGNGKADRRRLAELAAADQGPAATPLQGPAQAAVAAAFREVLGVAQPGPDDDFFSLGGHSLKAAQLVNRLEAATGHRLTLRQVFTAPTVAELAELVTAPAPAAAPIPSAGGPGDYPMTPAQRRLFVLDQLDQAGTAYNVPVAIAFDAVLDADRLDAALARLVARHEALRTGFTLDDAGRPIQRVAAAGEAAEAVGGGASPLLQRTTLPDTAEATLAQALAQFARPFDLARPPLLRAALAVTPSGESALFLDLHHIVCDGGSLGPLLADLGALYANPAAALPDPGPQAKDHAVWAAAQDLSDQARYWTERFADGGRALDFPLDRPRPARQSFAGAMLVRTWPAELRDRVTALAAAHQATEHMVVTAAVLALLARYGRDPDVTVGTAVAGRSHPGAERAVGMFVATLPLRAQADPALPFGEFLDQVRGVVLDALDRADYPFEALVDAVGAGRDLARNPLFDVMVAFQNWEPVSVTLAGADVTRVVRSAGTAKFDLSLDVTPEADGSYTVRAEYATALFDAASIEWFLDHAERLLAAAVGDPRVALGELPLDGPAEAALLARWGHGGPSEAGPSDTIVTLFRARVAADPGHAAVVGPDGAAVTYGELDAAARRVAASLRSAGVGPGDRVALLLGRGPELYCALLGVLYCGAAYAPLDPADPPARRAQLLADLDPALVLTALPDLSTAAPLDPADVAAAPDDPAYIIYTSGTTGRPKGVRVAHRGVANLVATFARDFQITPADQVLAFAPATFDAAVWEWAQALLLGATLRTIPEERTADPAWLGGFLASGVTVATLPPHVARATDVTHLRLLITAGSAAVPVELGGARFVNAYGPTETTICATAWAKPDGPFPPLIPIGRPLRGLDLWVVDPATPSTAPSQDTASSQDNLSSQDSLSSQDNLSFRRTPESSPACQPTTPTTPTAPPTPLRPAGLGLPGELVVAGPAVALGYLNQPELTAERFCPGPDGRTVYRTGDLVRWTAAGQLVHLGRADDQVKVHGVRVEPGEVEAHLLAVPGVTEAAAVARPTASGSQTLVAYVVAAAPLDPAATLARLAAALPTAAVPTALVQLDALPRTSAGKLDRRRLPAPLAGGSAGPVSAAEQAVADAFAVTLGADRIGRDDDFYALGGDSIAAIRVAGLVRDAGWTVAAADVMAQRTPHAIAQVATPGAGSGGSLGPTGSGAAPAEQGEVAGPVPLSPIQRWFFDLHLPEPQHFGQAVLLTHPGLDETALQEALDAVAATHDELRATFPGRAQVLRPVAEFGHVPLTVTPGPADAAAVAARGTELQSGFDLAAGPLLAAHLWQGGAGDHLLLAAHHLVIDGVSWRTLVPALATAYTQAAAGQPITLAPKTTSYREWVEALSAYAGGARTRPGGRALWLRSEERATATGPDTVAAAGNNPLLAQADWWRAVGPEAAELPPTGLAQPTLTARLAPGVTR
ncbi:MAG: D-alanine--poly(phosphoribitol) ligase subunit DltA, partial [Propionibacteriaceae bacterium]|nr:D-alanine--poly(phosphoribitol) ligase subunit DltA [Propionibacteriaceae bacterium]